MTLFVVLFIGLLLFVGVVKLAVGIIRIILIIVLLMFIVGSSAVVIHEPATLPSQGQDL